VETCDIEVQRLKSIRHDKGMIELGIDAQVLPSSVRDGEPRDQSPARPGRARAQPAFLAQLRRPR
jgi:hypothetical protein